MSTNKSNVHRLTALLDFPPLLFSYGPIFGAGADLSVASHCQSGMECYSNMPHTYTGETASNSILMGDYNFNVLDYEVFTAVSS